MDLSDKDIENLQVLYSKRYGTEISKKQAVEMGTRLLNLFRAVLKPSPQINLSELNQINTCLQQKNRQVS